MKPLAKAPLDLLRTFEAAGRTGAFALAASEPEPSPSAISHAIRKLESLLDVHLLQRNTREITLTREGEILFEHIQWGFNELQQGLASVTADESRPLRLYTTPSFARQWLLPCPGKFIRKNPGIDLQPSASTEHARFGQDDFDLDIVYGELRPPSYEKIPLAIEKPTPLCSPQLVERLRKPEDLYALILIQCDVQLYQWKGWFEANKMTSPSNYGLRFDRSFMATAVAADGLGVVLESKLLAKRGIASGELVCPLVNSISEIHYIGHYLVSLQYQHVHSVLDAFKTWLLSELDLGKVR